MPLLRKLTALAGTAVAARSYVRHNPEKVNRMAAKAGQFIDRKTKGRYHDKIDHAVHRVERATDPHRKPGH